MPSRMGGIPGCMAAPPPYLDTHEAAACLPFQKQLLRSACATSTSLSPIMTPCLKYDRWWPPPAAALPTVSRVADQTSKDVCLLVAAKGSSFYNRFRFGTVLTIRRKVLTYNVSSTLQCVPAGVDRAESNTDPMQGEQRNCIAQHRASTA
uniref:Uncharacterized protein n=1 Tax=Eutreptiella gymnastica TaxID=73025 RepID=A0A7S4FDV4_9EUGL